MVLGSFYKNVFFFTYFLKLSVFWQYEMDSLGGNDLLLLDPLVLQPSGEVNAVCFSICIHAASLTSSDAKEERLTIVNQAHVCVAQTLPLALRSAKYPPSQQSPPWRCRLTNTATVFL